jgi:hypothetical protein
MQQDAPHKDKVINIIVPVLSFSMLLTAKPTIQQNHGRAPSSSLSSQLIS